jgi:hypothetical protein
MEKEEEEEEDRKREAAISSSPCLQPNFNPKAVTQDQLSKFRVSIILNFHYLFFYTFSTLNFFLLFL